MIKIKNYINGKLSVSLNKEYIDVFNPSIGKVYAQCPNSNLKDLDNAIKGSEIAFKKWSNLSQKNRSGFLFKIADLIENNLNEFAEAESIDNGKPYELSKSLDIPRSIKNLRFFASMANNLDNESYHKENIVSHILRQPIGIVGTISPWNLPLYLFTWKIAPALVSGNCVIAKPSEITPYTAYLFSKMCIKAKLPNGVLSILHGDGQIIGEEIVNHKKIKAISFTGGTDTGKKIAKKAATSLKKISLEMGGKNPVIIFDDCNYGKMIDSLLKSSFLNQGQICLAGSRVYVQETIYKKFKKDFISKVQNLKIGDPFNPDTDQGAIVSNTHLNKILKYIDKAKEEGGIILTGGIIPKINKKCSSGWFVTPTVIENIPENSVVNQEEIFGPVVTLNTFKNEKQAIELANNSDYGLASIIWTNDMKRADKLAELIESGLVWINCWLERDLRTPFGGIKNSGFGKEGGKYALDFFTEPKNICTKYYD
tara:strand:- start:1209 stop:2654 length:1446 start_codon:yes stop_codon:yes gene_type:complete